MIRAQGIGFSVAALALTAASLTLPAPAPGPELLVLAGLIVVLGVPHGALDPVFARATYRLRAARGWVGFALGYVALAAVVVAIWRLSPALFLVGFLVVSAAHFSGDPTPRTPWPTRLLYGGAIVVLPSLLHGPDVARLFAALVPVAAATPITADLHRIGWPWLVGLLAAAALRARHDRVSALELASVATLATLMPPLPAFAVFFCGMHSARHILRTAAWADGVSTRTLLLTALAPMLGIALLAALAWSLLGGVVPDARVIQVLFVGLAALTVPHMALVERVRLSGWANPVLVSAGGSGRSSAPRSAARRA